MFYLDLSVPGTPRITHNLAVSTELTALRADPTGGLVYAVGINGPQSERLPVIDFRTGTPEIPGQHDLQQWVERRDFGRISVRPGNGHSVMVAEVLR